MALIHQLTIFIAILIPLSGSSQDSDRRFFQKDSLQIVDPKPSEGFNYPYVLFIPKGTPKNKLIYLLVEPNNTGRASDDFQMHRQSAIDFASKSSVGNNVSTNLKIPLLIPVFPRPASKPLVYTHALDKDVMKEKAEMERIDLQLIAMIDDAKKVLGEKDVTAQDKIFMNGFSASATFTNRFMFLHPERIKAAAVGGFNGI